MRYPPPADDEPVGPGLHLRDLPDGVRQGHDTGTQYRTGVYYTDKDDETAINEVFADEQKHINGKIAVENLPLRNFYKAEDYHQNYLDKNPNGYCHLPQSLFEFARKARDNRAKTQ